MVEKSETKNKERNYIFRFSAVSILVVILLSPIHELHHGLACWASGLNPEIHFNWNVCGGIENLSVVANFFYFMMPYIGGLIFLLIVLIFYQRVKVLKYFIFVPLLDAGINWVNSAIIRTDFINLGANTKPNLIPVYFGFFIVIFTLLLSLYLSIKTHVWQYSVLKEDYPRLETQIEDWKNFVIYILIPSIIVLGIFYTQFPNEPDKVISTFSVYLALIGILFYGTAVPTIRPRIYTQGICDNQLFTGVIIQNASRFPARAYVNLNVKRDENPEPSIHKYYSGKKAWVLFPNEGINGHFEIPISEEDLENKPIITIDLQVRNAGFSQYLIRYHTGHWRFDFGKEKWENMDFNYHS